MTLTLFFQSSLSTLSLASKFMQVLMHIFKIERLLCHYYTHLIHILIRRMLLFDTKIALFKWKKV